MAVPPEPIDLEALEREAHGTEGDRTVVSRAWLKRALEEIAAGRRAKAALDEVYGPGCVIK
jgi:hypothetical protein